jgi:hypothetical protein
MFWWLPLTPFKQLFVYIGLDDCNFVGWDSRGDTLKPAFQITKAHKTVICCILKNPNNPYSLLVVVAVMSI